MIPITLQIKNFLSYGDQLQTINFEPYHLVCLSGKNGHGKSALLDAITWAVWGQARKVSSTSKADQGLLRLGQTHMLVILDFECNSIHYRIRREFAFTYGKPYAALDFGIIDQATDTIIPLTEKTIRGTQEKIEQTILLDYETFINSAFLRQGCANEFSKKSPKDRKEILANILGLQRYEHLKKIASDSARTQTTQKQQLLALQAKIEIELAKRSEIEKNIAIIQASLKEHNVQREKLVNTQKRLEQQHMELIALKHMQEQHIKDVHSLTTEYDENIADLHNCYTLWRTTHKKQLHLSSYEELKKQKNELYTQITHIQKQLQLKLEKQEAYVTAQQHILLLEQQLKQEHMQVAQQQTMQLQYVQLQHKETQQKIVACQQQLQEIEKELTTLQLRNMTLEQNVQKNNVTDLAKIEYYFDKRRTYYQRWITQANWIKNEYDQIEQKKILVNDTDAPCCPLCEQNLSATRKKFLKQKLSKNTQTLGHRYQRLKRLITNIKEILITQHTQLTTLKQQQNTVLVDMQEIKHAQQLINELTNKQTNLLNQLAHLQQELVQQETALKTCEATINKTQHESIESLHSHPIYKERQLELQTLKAAYEAIIYNQTEHIRLQELLQNIELQLTQHIHIQQEITLQSERKKHISLLCQKIKKLKERRNLLDVRAKEYVHITELEKTYQADSSSLAQISNEWHKEKERLLQDLARLEQQISHLNALQQEHVLQQKRITELTQEIDDHQEIAQALSKNGIQALLIEDAIPEIEQEANELLHKLTDNQATILIESLRDLKKGGTKETLDINIADAVGIRPYELFSGGEAFRIDFSLRIAISKLLARRAGTSLQTLIIDEGFGSQDDEGLSYIMDALYKIQDDFKKIIIVSHLPRLKDQFPVHFHIHKNPHGSSVNIIEQA